MKKYNKRITLSALFIILFSPGDLEIENVEIKNTKSGYLMTIWTKKTIGDLRLIYRKNTRSVLFASKELIEHINKLLPVRTEPVA